MLRLAIIPGLLIVAACAVDTRPGPGAGGGMTMADGPQCFRLEDVTAYSRESNDAVIVQTAAGHHYRLNLFGACGGMRWTEAIERSRGTGRVCPGGNVAGMAYNFQRCQISRAEMAQSPRAPMMAPMPRDEAR